MKPTKIWGSACWPWDQNQIWWTTLFKPIIIHLCPSMEANSIYAHWFGFLSVGNSSHRLQCLKNKLTHIELYSLVALSAALWFPAPMSINLILYIYILWIDVQNILCVTAAAAVWGHLPQSSGAKLPRWSGKGSAKLRRRLRWWQSVQKMAKKQCTFLKCMPCRFFGVENPFWVEQLHWLFLMLLLLLRSCAIAMNLPSCPKPIFGFLLRTGGKFLKSSAAYPKRFGQAIRNNHQRFLKKEICYGKRYRSETGISVDQLVKGFFLTTLLPWYLSPSGKKCTSISK